jgi:hypothetical protein
VKRFPIIIILAAVVAGGQADATQRGLMAATKVEPRLLEKIYATCGEVGERDSNVEQGVSRWIHLTSVGIPQLLPQTGAAESTAGDRQ